MKLLISLTNQTISYELDQIARTESEPLVEALTADLERFDLLRQFGFANFFMLFDLYGRSEDRVYFPQEYPKALQIRSMPRTQIYEASCAIDWSDWKPAQLVKAGLNRWPSPPEVRSRLDAYARVVLAQAALEHGEPVASIAALLGEVPLISLDAIALAVKRRRRSLAKPKRRQEISLEIRFPLSFDRSVLRDLIEHTVEAGKLGQVDGFSSGPRQHEIGLVVTDAVNTIAAIRTALNDAGHDLTSFEFEVED